VLHFVPSMDFFDMARRAGSVVYQGVPGTGKKP
jgi:hypothetical protein